MPFQIIVEDERLYVLASGYVTLEEFFRLLVDVAVLDEQAPKAYDRLTDLTEVVASDVTAEQIRRAAGERRVKKLKNPVRSAIVAPQMANYGFARMFQTLNDNPDITISVFRSREDANVWLKGSGPRV